MQEHWDSPGPPHGSPYDRFPVGHDSEPSQFRPLFAWMRLETEGKTGVALVATRVYNAIMWVVMLAAILLVMDWVGLM